MASHGRRKCWARVLAAACLVLLTTLGISSIASAAPSGASGAEGLKEKGDASFDARHYAEALEQYQAALAWSGDPRLRYNIAQALTALERYPEALVSYQAFLADAPPGILKAAQKELFFALLDELKSKIARVEIRCDVAGARVLIRNTVVGTTPFAGPISVNAGAAKIEIFADGFKTFAEDVNLAGGQLQTVTAALERIDFTGTMSVSTGIPGARVLVDGKERGVTPLVLHVSQGAHVVVVRADGYVEQSKTVTVLPGGRTGLGFSLVRSPDYTLAYVGFGVGLAGVSVGSVTGILAFTTLSSARTQCDGATKQCGPAGQPDLENSKTYGTLSTIAFGVGAAGVGVGVFGLIHAHRRPAEGPTPMQVVLSPARLELRGSF